MPMNKVIQQSLCNSPVKNLLDNSNFLNPINQRGQTSYNGTFIYTIDRWSLDDSASTVVLTNEGLSFTGGGASSVAYIFQRLNGQKAGTYTYAAKFHGNTGQAVLTTWASDNQIGGGSDISNEIEGILITTFTLPNDLDSSNAYVRLQNQNSSASIVWEWAALYEGEFTKDTLPVYQSKEYSVELRECQRYFARMSPLGTGHLSNGSEVRTLNLFLPVEMRAKPVVYVADDFKIIIRGDVGYDTYFPYSGGGGTPTETYLWFPDYQAKVDYRSICVGFKASSTSNITNNSPIAISPADENSYIYLSADL